MFSRYVRAFRLRETTIDTPAAERWPSFRQARRWGARGFWAVTDQGLISVSNFLLNILLARWLSRDEYGAFTVGFSVLLVVGSFHGALLTDPMMVFGASRFAEAPNSYLRVLILGHWVLTVPLALAALAIGLGLHFLGTDTLSLALIGLAGATPVYLFVMLLRQAFYVRTEPRESAIASGFFLFFSLLGAYALVRMTNPSPASGFVALGAGSLASSLWLLLRLRTTWSIPTRAEISEVLAVHWGFSRWILGAHLVLWVRGNLYFLILPLWGGLEASAAFRAMTNLIMPLTQPLAAIAQLLLPVFARARARDDFGVSARRIGLLLTTGAIVYWLVLGSFGETILRWLYAGKYGEYGQLVWVIGLVSICSAVGATVGPALRAMERTDIELWVTFFSGLTVLTVGVALTRVWGVAGAVVGWTFSYMVSAVLMTATFGWLLASERGSRRARPSDL